MAIDIDWAGTATNPYRIFVPRADMPIVQTSPEIRELDVDAFRLALKDLEASVAGMPWPDTHRHVTETTLSGFVYARSVEILAPYQVEFEDGQYSVRALGANHNILDVKVNNQVSLAVQNSAGLITSPELQFASFEGVVSVDPTSSYTGTAYPVGSRRRPVNNMADALTIATERGLSEFYIMDDLTLASVDVSEMTFTGQNSTVVLTVGGSATVTDCSFNNITLTGTLDGAAHIRNCNIDTIAIVHGHVISSALIGTITTSGTGALHVINCYDGLAGAGIPTIDCGGSGSDINIREYRGGLAITNKTGADEVSIDLIGRLVLDATVTAGLIIVRGIGKITLGGTTATVDSAELVSPQTVDDKLSTVHGAGAWDSAGSSDWTATEKNQIRGALGLVGTQAPPAGGGHLQDIRTPVQANLDATITSRAEPGDEMTLTPTQSTMLLEIYRLYGLDPTKPLVVSTSARKVPASGSDIDQTITDNSGTITIQRV
jgi:hypothetical protein